MEENNLFERLFFIQIKQHLLNSNKILLGQINICLNQINVFFQNKGINALIYHGQKYNLFDLRQFI